MAINFHHMPSAIRACSKEIPFVLQKLVLIQVVQDSAMFFFLFVFPLQQYCLVADGSSVRWLFIPLGFSCFFLVIEGCNPWASSCGHYIQQREMVWIRLGLASVRHPRIRLGASRGRDRLNSTATRDRLNSTRFPNPHDLSSPPKKTGGSDGFHRYAMMASVRCVSAETETIHH